MKKKICIMSRSTLGMIFIRAKRQINQNQILAKTLFKIHSKGKKMSKKIAKV